MAEHDEPTSSAGPGGAEVSVVIPTRDRPALARRAIASALAQEDVTVEVVVVDDGSQPPFDAPPDPRVAVVRHPTSRGVATARNTGVEAARAPWVALLDDDDFWAPGKLRTQLAVAGASEAGLVCCSALLVAEGRAVSVAEALPADELARGLRRANLVPAGASNVLVAAAALRAAGPFDVRLRHLDDWDMWIRLTSVTELATCPEPLVAYVQHPGGKHVAERASVRQDARMLRRLHAGAGRITAFDRGVYALYVADGLRQAGRPFRAAGVEVLAAVRHGRPGYLRLAAGELARATGLNRRPRRAQPATPDWVRRQWDVPVVLDAATTCGG